MKKEEIGIEMKEMWIGIEEIEVDLTRDIEYI